MAQTAVEVGGRPARSRRRDGDAPRSSFRTAALFLVPAAVFIGALILYPTIDTVGQSFQNDARQFVGLDNYKEVVSNARIVTAIRNSFVWVVFAPGLVTGFGLIMAVLTERVRYTTAVKLALFMPFVISGLAAGVLWRLNYESDPERGLVNAVIRNVSDIWSGRGAYPAARPLPDAPMQRVAGGAYEVKRQVSPGDAVDIGLVNVLDSELPSSAQQAARAEPAPGEVSVLVWRDFKPGGGKPGVVEEGEVGLPGTVVELVGPNGDIVASGETSSDGTVSFADVGHGPFTARLAASNFSEGFQGIEWLGPSLVTPALIVIFFWASVGLAVVVIGGGLSALPRDVLEAARIDGANEWQAFRYVTVPLMRPIIGVVFVTLTINVLKLFDLVWVTAPGGSQQAANVIAVEMFRSGFVERNFGVAAAVAVVLFILIRAGRTASPTATAISPPS